MNSETFLLYFFLYKIISLIIGLVVIFLGYNLFRLGIWGSAGNIDANFGNNKILMKKAAPGTFFVVLGAFILVFTLNKGWHYKDTVDNSSNNKVELPSTLPN